MQLTMFPISPRFQSHARYVQCYMTAGRHDEVERGDALQIQVYSSNMNKDTTMHNLLPGVLRE
jgi:hypothetical protein